jgi:hypothetical protein
MNKKAEEYMEKWLISIKELNGYSTEKVMI